MIIVDSNTWADFFNARNRVALLVTTLPSEDWRRQWRAILSGHLRSIARAAPEGRAPAVWSGTLHAIWRLRRNLRRRRKMGAAGTTWNHESPSPR